MNASSDIKCACPDCKCSVSEGHHVVKDGKDYCSEACASGHASGDGCCNGVCDCHG
ncbi:MAG: metallothionein [Verrucomicrobiota bacterium]|nr:metallothionein [Verrucomicrobiota bacterium]